MLSAPESCQPRTEKASALACAAVSASGWGFVAAGCQQSLMARALARCGEPCTCCSDGVLADIPAHHVHVLGWPLLLQSTQQAHTLLLRSLLLGRGRVSGGEGGDLLQRCRSPSVLPQGEQQAWRARILLGSRLQKRLGQAAKGAQVIHQHVEALQLTAGAGGL